MSEEKLTSRWAGLSFEELNNALVDVWESFEAKRPKSHPRCPISSYVSPCAWLPTNKPVTYTWDASLASIASMHWRVDNKSRIVLHKQSYGK